MWKIRYQQSGFLRGFPEISLSKFWEMLRAKSREYLSRTPCLLPILVLVLKSRFARNPHMVIFGCQNRSKWILFPKSTWKTRKKNVKTGKFFFWSYGGLIWDQKWTHTKIDHFTKNGPKSSILSIFHRGKAQNNGN